MADNLFDEPKRFAWAPGTRNFVDTFDFVEGSEGHMQGVFVEPGIYFDTIYLVQLATPGT